MCCNMFDHVGFLPERSVTNVASERFFTSVDFQMLFEIEPFAIDE